MARWVEEGEGGIATQSEIKDLGGAGEGGGGRGDPAAVEE